MTATTKPLDPQVGRNFTINQLLGLIVLTVGVTTGMSYLIVKQISK